MNESQNKFNEYLIQEAWEKGLIVDDQDPKLVRRDEQGELIKREDFLNPASIYGWKIEEHLGKSIPKSYEELQIA